MQDGRTLFQLLLTCEATELWLYLQLAWTKEFTDISLKILWILDPHILRLLHLKTQIQDLSDTNSQLKQLMLWIAETHDVYPPQMNFIAHIKKNPNAHAGGACGDVFIGECEGQRFAMKRSRFFLTTTEVQRKIGRAHV